MGSTSEPSSVELFDVIAVELDLNTVRLMNEGLLWGEAEAVVNLAVLRRGVDSEFFVAAKTGTYQTGDIYGANRASNQ